MKLIYLASPYSDKDPKVQTSRYKLITKVAAYLTLNTGNCFFLPITQSYQLVKMIPALGGSFANWRDIDLYAISKSDEVWVVTMDGWKESVGVTAEIKFAIKSGIPVKYFDVEGKQIDEPRAKRKSKAPKAKSVHAEVV